MTTGDLETWARRDYAQVMHELSTVLAQQVQEVRMLGRCGLEVVMEAGVTVSVWHPGQNASGVDAGWGIEAGLHGAGELSLMSLPRGTALSTVVTVIVSMVTLVEHGYRPWSLTSLS